MKSPYNGIASNEWGKITRKLIKEHPLKSDEIIEIVLQSWNSIFDSKLGTKGFKIGLNIFPKPQIMGFFLHELIPLELTARYPDKWRIDKEAGDKDIVYLPDDKYSIEIKTSSNPSHIYGNRSYAQASTKNKKAKSGYYLAINFEKVNKKIKKPKILLIRFGWLDSDDWIGQKAATGQQSRLSPEVETSKFIQLFPS